MTAGGPGGHRADITQLREAEVGAKKLSEKRHRLMAENAWEVIWTMAMDTTITYVSPAVSRSGSDPRGGR